MYKILKADRDSYITNKVISGERVYNSNVGSAGSLDLFKLYGITQTNNVDNTELSRVLIHFNLDPLVTLFQNGQIDPSNPSFKCYLKLFDVYGGQTTPNNFTVNIYPLSKSFEEGLGRDVVYYSDLDSCNFISASSTSNWIMSGCEMPGFPNESVDYIVSNSSNVSYLSTQLFESGEENLEVDV